MATPSRPHAGICAAGAAFAVALFLAAPACNQGSSHDFLSDNPFGGGGYSNTGGTTATGTSTSSGDDASRAIAEADIIQLDNGRLYALSQYSGLSIIDVGTQDQLTVLGRYRTSATPFEMYLRDGTVYALFAGWAHEVCDAAGQTCQWQQTSHLEALDVRDAAHIVRLGSYDLPGSISDSRIVGDVLYAVSYENGYCYGCDSTPKTTVTSLSVHDAANIAVVDRLAFTSPDPDWYGFWKRSVSVNQDRMYVAGVDWTGSGEGHSTIQVVDISDPHGALIEGARVEAKGQIESRWQMDEQDGVLRVVSQPGTWNTAEAPTVQTFQVTSAAEVTPLAVLPMVLPRPERLRSVRFDGSRAFVITAVQTDPLFTLDLTDPAHPAQVGQLEMPGWVYFLEPRGDRVYALGYEQNNPEGSLAVSLFDVADLAAPSLVSRVHFGGDWSSLPEDQDRIHKAFAVDDAHGAIFVPYSAWSYDASAKNLYGCGAYSSGIQIVDFTHDTLAARGTASARGTARRAFVYEDRLFGVSDAAVSTFDITDRDRPAQKASVALSANVSQAAASGDKVVRLSNDWWTGAARLEVTSLLDPGRDEPLGALDLTALGDDPGRWCWGWSYWGAQVFTRGDFVYLVRRGYPYEYSGGGGSPHADIAVIDIADPAKPSVRGRLSFPTQIDYRWYGALLPGGSDIVLAGHALVLRNVSVPGGYAWDATTVEQASLDVVDLSDPDHPSRSTVALADGYGHTELLAYGSDVYTSHWSPADDSGNAVRFYVDHVDVSSAGAPVLVSTNVPGSLLAYDPPSGHVLSVRYERLVDRGVTYQDCYARYAGNAQFQPDDPYTWSDTALGTCSALHRTLALVSIGPDGASVLDEAALDDRLSVYQTLLGDDRVFLPGGYGYYYYGGGTGWGYGYGYGGTQDVTVVGGLRAGKLALGGATLPANVFSSAQAASGQRLVYSGSNPPGLSVLDAADLGQLTQRRVAELYGYPYAVTMAHDLALCSLGPWGLQVVDVPR